MVRRGITIRIDDTFFITKVCKHFEFILKPVQYKIHEFQ